MLSHSEVEALQRRTFRVHCLDIQLTPRSGHFPCYRGPGSIRQNEKGILAFELYDQTQEADPTLQPGAGAPGGLIPDDHFYHLAAVDLAERRWTAEDILPRHGGRVSLPGVVCGGQIREMRCPEEGRWPSAIRLFLPGSFDMPTNRVTEVIRKRSEALTAGGEKEVERSTTLDTWELNLVDLKITLTLTEGGLFVTAAGEEFPAGLDSRLEETLWFVLGRPCRWLFKMERRAGLGSTAVRSHSWTDFAPRLRPPVDWVYNPVEAVSQLFHRYLDYVSAYPEPRYHPTSVNVLQVCRASAQTVEAEALALGVAIESLIHREYAECGEPSPVDRAEVDRLLDLVARADVTDRMKDRARGALGRMKEANAEACLRHLERSGHVSPDMVDAWRRIRHATAHGREIEGPLEEIVRLCDRAYVLFTLLIFSRIGYTGEYTNRAVPDWPSVLSKPFWEPAKASLTP